MAQWVLELTVEAREGAHVGVKPSRTRYMMQIWGIFQKA